MKMGVVFRSKGKTYLMGVFLGLYFFICTNSFFPSDQDQQGLVVVEEDVMKNGTAFRNFLKDFPWDTLAHPSDSNETLRLKFYEALMEKILPFVIMEPIVPVNRSCGPPPLTLTLPKNPTCRILDRRRKVGMLFQFGFDVDILEITLNELDDVVDRFFILESTRSHYNASKKPLIWELAKRQPRFAKFLDKVVVFILDDADLAGMEVTFRGIKVPGIDYDLYGLERTQQRARWTKFLQWNNMTNYFKDEDILGFGSSDEIPSRNSVHFLRSCELPSDPVDIGSWYAFGYIKLMYRSFFTVKGHPYTYGNPSFFTVGRAKSWPAPDYPSRQQGASKSFIFGGVHLSDYGYLPYQVAKHLTVLEGYRKEKDNPADLYDQLVAKPMLEVAVMYARLPDQWVYATYKRVEDYDILKVTEPDELKTIYFLPWFYNCNKKRYPAWEREHDTRLD